MVAWDRVGLEIIVRVDEPVSSRYVPRACAGVWFDVMCTRVVRIKAAVTINESNIVEAS